MFQMTVYIDNKVNVDDGKTTVLTLSLLWEKQLSCPQELLVRPTSPN
jgi:hypothetical protein